MTDHSLAAPLGLREPFIGSIGFLRRLVGEDEEWLGTWSNIADAFEFPQARRGPDETFRSCLPSAIESTFGLDRRSDFVVSGLSRAHIQAPIQWSDTDLPQWVIVEFFVADLFGEQSRKLVDQRVGARWVTLREVARGRTADGDLISSKQRELILRADLLPARLSEYRE